MPYKFTILLTLRTYVQYSSKAQSTTMYYPSNQSPPTSPTFLPYPHLTSQTALPTTTLTHHNLPHTLSHLTYSSTTSNMPPKNKGKAKDSNADASASKSGGKLKPATSINVRHILCEKHSNKEKALEALREGRKFDDVAREMSEDKARQGELQYSIHDDLRAYISSVIHLLSWHTLLHFDS